MTLPQLWQLERRTKNLSWKEQVRDGAFKNIQLTKELALSGSAKDDLENNLNYNSSEIDDKHKNYIKINLAPPRWWAQSKEFGLDEFMCIEK